MSTFIDIDGADYVKLTYKGQTYYIGEEVILDSDKCPFGWICARGEVYIGACDDEGETIASCLVEDGDSLETDGDIIDAINELLVRNLDQMTQ